MNSKKARDKSKELYKQITRPDGGAEADTLLQSIIHVFSSFREGIYVVDARGRTVLANPAYEELTGIDFEEIQGQSVEALMRKGYFNPSVAQKVLETGKPQTMTQTNKNGKITLTTGTPILGEDGAVTGVVSSIQDITEIKRMSDELMTKTALLENQSRVYDSSLGRPEDPVIHESNSMQRVVRLVQRVAKTDANVLITGESGSGKGVITRLIYNLSGRAGKTLINLNCSAIPEPLLESELFGYMGGAFTGANRSGKVGLAEAANGGILFLDEIGDMPLSLQPKMLHFLETGEITKVGSTESKKLDVRVIAATNVDLPQRVAEGRFRSDLYYRLNVVPIHLPPLRERKDDVAPLILQTIKKHNSVYGEDRGISHEAFDMLVQYSWPGNVRELINLIERLLVLSEDQEIQVADLPPEVKINLPATDLDGVVRDIPLPTSMPRLLEEIEDNLIDRAMEQGGSIRAAAKLLEIHPSKLFRRINKSQ